uniref:Uncharacterized protein n=1 Tax=Panagrolaimus sp. PS1159 TaxID=55785 RepID=A0AC35G652_9BILA
MSSVRLIPLIFRGMVFLPPRFTTSSSSSPSSLLQPFRSFASYAPRSRKHSKSNKKSSAPPATTSAKFNENQIIPDALADLPQPERIYRRPQLHFNPEHDKDGSEYPAITLSKKEKEIGVEFLKKVVSTLDERGQTFVLPWGDDAAIESVLGILRELTTTTGVLPEFLFDAFTQKPELFAAITRDGNKCIEIFDCLCDMCGFSIQDTIRMFGSYTIELLETDSNEISQRLSPLLGVGIRAGKSLGRAVRRCPALLFASNPEQIGESIEALGSFFSRTILPKILANDPEIVLKNFEQIESIYEYIYYQMRCEPEEFVETKRWSQLSLDEIMNRHQFLLKTGKYELPDPKKPQLKMENPPLHRIFDTKDDIFATQVAKVTVEEWMMYKELAEKLEALEDKERPFERIKPSQRKAYERRLKETKEQEDYVFEA